MVARDSDAWRRERKAESGESESGESGERRAELAVALNTKKSVTPLKSKILQQIPISSYHCYARRQQSRKPPSKIPHIAVGVVVVIIATLNAIAGLVTVAIVVVIR